MISVNRSSRVEFANSAAIGMLGDVPLRSEGPVPETLLRFPLRSFAAGLFESDAAPVEAQAVGPDRELVFEITGIPAARSDSALVILRDVSERERRLRAEREFVDNAAHELRTPLAAITSAVERLQGGAREIPEKRDRFLGHIQRESARLNRLASSLLVLARAQTGDEAPQREEIALCGLLDDVASGREPGSGVELVLDCSPTLVAHGNRNLLEHVLVNLVDNALRHTGAGQVRISAEADTAGSVVIEVGDTGVGIPPEDMGRLFDRFYRGPSTSTYTSVGLGLPIAKEAVEAMGGGIEISSVLGEGTTARIVLPGVEAPVPA